MDNSYVNFVKAGGCVIVDTKTTQNPQQEKEIPMSCTMMTANKYVVENAKTMEKNGVSKYLHVEDREGYSVIRGVPYRSRRKTGVDDNGKTLYEQNPVSVASALFSHNLCICDEKSKEHLKELKQNISSHLTGKKKWETNLAMVVPVEEIPEYKPVEALTKEKEESMTIMVGGAFFMDDKEYGDFCDKLESMGNKVLRQPVGNNHSFQDYSRFMEDVEVDFMSAKDPNLQEYNPMKEIVDKIDKTIADNGYEVPDMIVIPDKAKEVASKEIYNGVSILENERRYYYKAFEGKEKKPQVKSESYEYYDKKDGNKLVKGTIWQSGTVHNEKLPPLDTILAEYKKNYADMANYTAERIFANTLTQMEKAKAGDAPAKTQEKAPEKNVSKSSSFSL